MDSFGVKLGKHVPGLQRMLPKCFESGEPKIVTVLSSLITIDIGELLGHLLRVDSVFGGVINDSLNASFANVCPRISWSVSKFNVRRIEVVLLHIGSEC